MNSENYELKQFYQDLQRIQKSLQIKNKSENNSIETEPSKNHRIMKKNDNEKKSKLPLGNRNFIKIQSIQRIEEQEGASSLIKKKNIKIEKIQFQINQEEKIQREVKTSEESENLSKISSIHHHNFTTFNKIDHQNESKNLAYCLIRQMQKRNEIYQRVNKELKKRNFRGLNEFAKEFEALKKIYLLLQK